MQVPWTGLAVLAVLALLAMPGLLRARRRQRWLAPTTDSARLAHGAWQELRATALDHGLGWPEGASPRMQAAHLRARLTSDVEAVTALSRLTGFVERARYGRATPVDPRQHEEVVADVQRWRQVAREAVSPRTARRARWWPPSLLDRPSPPPVLDEDDAPARQRPLGSDRDERVP